MASLVELLQPIADDSPAGTYLRYDPLYDRIKEARREDADLPQGDWAISRKTADWSMVIRLADEALSRRSKDLQIAAWLTEAWLRREGIAGLRQGIVLLHELLQKYWDDVYPPIEDGDVELRAAPLEWLGLKTDVAVRMAPINQAGHSSIDYQGAKSVPTREQAELDAELAAVRQQAVDAGRVTSEDFEAGFEATPYEWYRALVDDLDGSLSALAELNGYCDQQFGQVSPSFSPLRTVLEEVRRTAAQLLARKPVPVTGGQTAAAIGGAPPPIPGTTPVDSIGATIAPGGAPAGGDPASWIAAAAARLRSERPLDPAAYLLLRGFRWGELRAGGERVDPRLLAAPSTETRTRLKGLLLDARWSHLLEACETVMALPYGRGWLDLQRYVLTACDALGRDYFPVANSIRSELRALLRDLPALPSLALMDDSPTANAETLGWLSDQQLLPDGAEPVVLTAETVSTGRRDAYDVARDRVRAGDAHGAMQLLMTAAGQEKSPRARFLRRAQAASIMVGAGLEAVALPILKELLEQIEAHRLEDWEAGDMVADPLALLYQCAERLGSDDVDRASLYTRVCRLDPMAAIRLAGGNGSVHESE
jgi:type VI secretion system protein ImpA